MTPSRASLALAAAAAAALLAACASGGGASPAKPTAAANMSFFITSSNPGQGAAFGGLAGADRHCQALATAAGAGQKIWRAYLSTTGAGGVNARDRIGNGPWYNARGEMIAANLDELHGANKLTKQTALTERGEQTSGRGDSVNNHDILTGSMPDGRASTAAGDSTCGNWTSASQGAALVGHHDRMGLRDDAPSRSWNSSHPSQGCSLDALRRTGGGGLLYCFASN